MKLKIKLVDDRLPLPEYHTPGAVAFDLYSRIDVTIAPRSLARIPTNLIIEVPCGYMLYVKDRSSTVGKGLLATAGIIDQDYCGPDDEILFQVYNITEQQVNVACRERIAQAVLVKIAKVEWQPVAMISLSNRGGFGSSGAGVDR